MVPTIPDAHCHLYHIVLPKSILRGVLTPAFSQKVLKSCCKGSEYWGERGMKKLDCFVIILPHQLSLPVFLIYLVHLLGCFFLFLLTKVAIFFFHFQKVFKI